MALKGNNNSFLKDAELVNSPTCSEAELGRTLHKEPSPLKLMLGQKSESLFFTGSLTLKRR